MMELSYRRHRFPPVVIQHAVWLYLRFTLSYRDVEDLLAERLMISLALFVGRCRWLGSADPVQDPQSGVCDETVQVIKRAGDEAAMTYSSV